MTASLCQRRPRCLISGTCFEHPQAKIDAKIAEAQASLAAKEAAKKEEQKSKLGEADRATALKAEKAQRKEAEMARKAQEFIDAEKAPDAFINPCNQGQHQLYSFHCMHFP